MKKYLVVMIMLALVLTCGQAFAESNEREGTLIESLNVRSRNSVKGKITAEDGSNVSVGNVEINDTKSNKVDINTDNQTGEIEAVNSSEVSVGAVKMNNVDADGVAIDSRNRVDGKIFADEGTVNVGGVELNNFKGGKVNIKTDNHVQGGVRATKGSSVKVGGVTTR